MRKEEGLETQCGKNNDAATMLGSSINMKVHVQYLACMLSKFLNASVLAYKLLL